MIAAAIWYTIDQNEPSSPFLLELACPEVPTKQELEDALRKYALSTNEDADTPCSVHITSATSYGDLVVELDDDSQLLFIGLPTALEHLAKEFKD